MPAAFFFLRREDDAEPRTITQSNSHSAVRVSNRSVHWRLYFGEVTRRAAGNRANQQVLRGATERRQDLIRTGRAGNANLRRRDIPAPGLQPVLVRAAASQPAGKSVAEIPHPSS